MSISSTGLYGSATIVNSDLFTDVETLKETVTTLNTTYLQTTVEHRADISLNRFDISQNKADISENRFDISQNKADISLNRFDMKCLRSKKRKKSPRYTTPETRQAPRDRATRTCLRWRR